jgi:multidrug efflux system membrane fusion protein
MQTKVHKPKRWLMSIPVLLGLAVFVLLLKTRDPPQQAALQERAHPVRVIKVPRVNLIPRVRAYGTVAPGKVWEAVTQVSGKVIEMHPKLEVGECLGQGTELLHIEPKDYELAIT